MNDQLQQEVRRSIELYCIDKGYTEASAANSFVPHDTVTAFGMANYIVNEIGCMHFVVAPRGHSYGYFFAQFGCKVMDVFVSAISADIQVVEDLSCIRKRRVFIIDENFESEPTLQPIVSLLLQYDPAEICLFLGNSYGFESLENVPKSISQIFIPDQIYNYISTEQLETEFAGFFARIIPAPVVKECVKERVQREPAIQSPYNISKTLKHFFKRLKYTSNNWEEIGYKRYRTLSSIMHLSQGYIADNTSFLYFMMNIFKAVCMSHISVQPGLAIPLSLMLVLKYSRGMLRTGIRKKTLLISLTHPIDIAERLMAHCLRRSIMPMLNGDIRDQDWPRLARAAGEVCDLGIDFWKEGVFFDTDHLKRIIESSECPFGLVVINDSTGQLTQEHYDEISPIQQLNNIRSLSTELNLPIIVINSSPQEDFMDADVFDHVAELCHEVDRYQLFIRQSDKQAYGKLTFVMSRTCNILEDALANFTRTKPANYN